MNIFDDDIQPGCKPKSTINENDCDIFEPSVYVPDESKYRVDYIKRITAKISVEFDNELATSELPDGEEPLFDLEVTGKDPEKHLKFIAKYLRGPRGFNGSIDNFVVLTEAEYDRLVVKDPNKFYFTYEGEESQGYVEDMVLITTDFVDDHILVTTGQINNNILTI